MKKKNLYRADEILIRTAVFTGVIAGLYILQNLNLYKEGVMGEDISGLLIRVAAAASVPLVFGMTGSMIRKAEKDYLEVWKILERSVEISFSEIESTTGFDRDMILKALRVINRRSGTVYLVDPAHDLVYDGRLSGRVAGSAVCPGCGGSVSGLVKLSRTDVVMCPNCGRRIEFSPGAVSDSKEERLRAIREEDRKAEAGEREVYKGDFKPWVFVVLVMFFWPAAIWYLIKNYPLRRI